jgi:hypothetical protein
MTNEWQYNDIPLSKFKVLTEPDPISGDIRQITDIAGKISEEIIRTQSDQIRNALIDLGWTPPEGLEVMPPTKLPANFRDHWLPKAVNCKIYGIRIDHLPLYDILAVAAHLFDLKALHVRKCDL